MSDAISGREAALALALVFLTGVLLSAASSPLATTAADDGPITPEPEDERRAGASTIPPGVAPPLEDPDRTQPIVWEDRIPLRATTCGPAGCQDPSGGGPGTTFWPELRPGETPTSVDLRMYYEEDQVHPVVTQVYLGVTRDDCPNGQCDMVAFASGTSPVTLTIEDLEDQDLEAFGLVVWTVTGASGVTPIWTSAGDEVPFLVEGEVRYLRG